jgi:hypothetical protein
MIKTYTSKYFFFTTYIKVNGKNKHITFQGGSYQTKTNGIYTTNNKEEQEAIESSELFKNKVIWLKATYGKAEEDVKPTITKEVKQEVKKDIKEEKNTADTDVKVYADVTTVQQASRLINKEYAVPFAQISTKDKILAKAKELNISLPNLK